VEFLGKPPHRGDDEHEINEEEGDSLLGVLDVGGVQMHMVLRVEVMVDHGVHVLQVHQASVLVRGRRLRVRFVEVPATRGEGKGGGEEGSGSHGLSQQK